MIPNTFELMSMQELHTLAKSKNIQLLIREGAARALAKRENQLLRARGSAARAVTHFDYLN